MGEDDKKRTIYEAELSFLKDQCTKLEKEI